ncbi:MAG: methyltransferase domain-containing protein [Nocardioides sp.]|nr:methyltransferase domain-containing protein [Nocardioides sp.]
MWDPDQYLRYADQRARPFLELVARVPLDAPDTVVDLGCGPATLTALLRERWPDARVTGVDSSPEMVARARAEVPGLEVVEADVTTWRPAEPVDLLLSNATLQWVPGHLDLLPGLLEQVRPGGCLAFGVPGNFTEPSHTERLALASEPPYAEHTVGVPSPAAHDAATYLEVLAGLGCTVDAWETTYLHVLHGPDPVLDWIAGTSLSPTLQALPGELREPFCDELRSRLTAAYPDRGNGVVLPFRRVFVIARR